MPTTLPTSVSVELADGTSVSAGAVHVRIGIASRFGWWVGVLRRPPFEDPVWECGHQHEDRGVALGCSRGLVEAMKGEREPVRLRREW